jgi:hypothetical protein
MLTKLTAEEIRANCALGESCDCSDGKMRHRFDKGEAKPWLCSNWGRSTLGNPAIVGRDPAYKA